MPVPWASQDMWGTVAESGLENSGLCYLSHTLGKALLQRVIPDIIAGRSQNLVLTCFEISMAVTLSGCLRYSEHLRRSSYCRVCCQGLYQVQFFWGLITFLS